MICPPLIHHCENLRPSQVSPTDLIDSTMIKVPITLEIESNNDHRDNIQKAYRIDLSLDFLM